MANFVKKHIHCPACSSSDAYCVDAKGNGYCYSCAKEIREDGSRNIYFGGGGGGGSGVREPLGAPESGPLKSLEAGGTYSPLKSHGVSRETCEFFDVKTKDSKIVFPYYNNHGSLVAQKVRTDVTPKGHWVGTPKESTLFGSQKFTSSGNTITIVEGEPDVLAFRDICGDFPVVSIINGAATAFKDIEKNLDYFDNFRNVYICFDNDAPGRKAALEVAKLFPLGKVKIVSLRHYKDAGEYLKNGKKEEFKRCWHTAKDYTPAGIVFGTSLLPRIKEKLESRKVRAGVGYPFEKLNNATYGIRFGEMVTIVAGTGVGKSLFLSEIMHNILKTTNEKIGVLMMEESVEMANLRLMSINASKPFHLPDTVYSEEELNHHAAQTIELLNSEGEPRVVSFDHFGSNAIDEILSKVDFMAAIGCKYIFIDHISIMVSDQSHGDERKALDEIATKLRMKVQERDIALFVVSHLRRPGGRPHEEGGETSLADIRGTAGIGQLSDIAIGLERNGQHKDEHARNVTRMRVLKNRFSGLTGLTSSAHYDHGTGRLLESHEDEFEHDSDDDDPFDKTT